VVAATSQLGDRFCAGTVRPWVATQQRVLTPGVVLWRFLMLCLFPREEHLFPMQKAVGSQLVLRASTRPSRSPYCSGATPRVRLCATIFLWCHLDLPKACFHHISSWPPFGQHLDLPWRCVGLTRFWSGRWFFKQWQCLVFTSSPKTCSPEVSCLPSYALGNFFIPVHLTRPSGATSSLCIDVNSFPPLQLHVDRGLERHGYPWVPTDQGPRGPCHVDPTGQKARRPANAPGDLIHNPDDLGRPRTTSSRLRKTWRACGASFSQRSLCGTASMSEARDLLCNHGRKPS
jgi:hypothetical protein